MYSLQSSLEKTNHLLTYQVLGLVHNNKAHTIDRYTMPEHKDRLNFYLALCQTHRMCNSGNIL